ncbi:hypothetical protein [Pseudomonas sp. PS02302]|uniref:hypothetical protein n=1 Tax=Pseudomonas sp. PS02302 TaxID=2991428 RepID=UPI00249B8B7C|nr:hypothetical protein [Pseudomonas sp. PS02302]
MAAKFTNCGAFGCAEDGFRVTGEVNAEFDGCVSVGNGGQGFNILPKAPLMEKLGLPADTDPTKLAEILRALQGIPKAEQAAEAEKRGFKQILFGVLKEGPAYLNNVLQLANSPQVQQLIQMLSS